jgi:hypothetical protein
MVKTTYILIALVMLTAAIIPAVAVNYSSEHQGAQQITPADHPAAEHNMNHANRVFWTVRTFHRDSTGTIKAQ